MEIQIELVEGNSDALRRLASRLPKRTGVERVELVHRPSGPDRLSAGLLDILLVTLGAGGAGTVVVAQVLGWLRMTSNVTLRLSVGAKEFVLECADIRQMNPDQLAELVAAMSRVIETEDTDDD